MTQPGILFDENLPPRLTIQMRRHAPEIPVLAVGDPTAPPFGTLDPEILLWLEQRNFWLVTNNRTSMPGHLRDHLVDGHHIPGILITPYPINIGELIEELILIWQVSFPDDFQDMILYLPLSR